MLAKTIVAALFSALAIAAPIENVEAGPGPRGPGIPLGGGAGGALAAGAAAALGAGVLGAAVGAATAPRQPVIVQAQPQVGVLRGQPVAQPGRQPQPAQPARGGLLPSQRQQPQPQYAPQQGYPQQQYAPQQAPARPW